MTSRLVMMTGLGPIAATAPVQVLSKRLLQCYLFQLMMYE